MNTRQAIICKLKEHGVNISSNILEGYIFEYRKKYNNVYKGIDLLFDMLDSEEEFLVFLVFINNRGDVTQTK